MSEIRRPTQKDIAEKTGFHRATVSLALKNHPSIPEATRKRIHQAADQLGYKPDPMLTALAAYRSRQHPHSFQGTLAWLENRQANVQWRPSPIFEEYKQGAIQSAEKYGYNVETFVLNEAGITARRMTSIFRSRNISGLLLCPQATPHTEMIFPWHLFSAVTFGYTLVKPQLHTIAATQYRGMLTLMRELQNLGYKRIGYIPGAEFNQRTDNNYMAGYLVEELKTHLPSELIPIMMDNCHEEPSLFRKWIKAHKIDAVVTPDTKILKVLDHCGLKAPRDLGVACTSLKSPNDSLAGIYENSIHIGEAATDFLVAMIQRGERGIPLIPQRLLIEGRWITGKTVRRQRI